jgi:hypothetical protein
VSSAEVAASAAVPFPDSVIVNPVADVEGSDPGESLPVQSVAPKASTGANRILAIIRSSDVLQMA